MVSKILLKIVVISVILGVALACNGYKIKILKAENCGDPDPVITIDPEFSLKLNKKCEIIPSGCIVNKAFSTAVSKYKIVKDGIVLKEGKVDMCSMAEQASDVVRDYLKLFGAPAKCPVEEGKICSNDHKVDLSKYKSMLSVARGHIVIDSKVEHDTGKSCFHIEFEITKG